MRRAVVLAALLALAAPASGRAALHEACASRPDGPVHGAAAVAGGLAFVPSEDGHVYAFDLRTRPTALGPGDRLVGLGTARRHGGCLYVGSGDDRMYASARATVAAAGRSAPAGDITGGAALARGLVIFGSSDHRVYALSGRPGARALALHHERARRRHARGQRRHRLRRRQRRAAARAGPDDGRERWSGEDRRLDLGQAAVDDGASTSCPTTRARAPLRFDRATGGTLDEQGDARGRHRGPVLAATTFVAPGIDTLNAYDRGLRSAAGRTPRAGILVAPGATLVTTGAARRHADYRRVAAAGTRASSARRRDRGGALRHRGPTLGAVSGSPVVSGGLVLFGRRRRRAAPRCPRMATARRRRTRRPRPA